MMGTILLCLKTRGVCHTETVCFSLSRSQTTGDPSIELQETCATSMAYSSDEITDAAVTVVMVLSLLWKFGLWRTAVDAFTGFAIW